MRLGSDPPSWKKPIIKERKCKTCGKQFKTDNPNKFFCKETCRPSYRKNKREKRKATGNIECLKCEVKFKPTHKYNRICQPCKISETWVAANSLVEVTSEKEIEW